MSQINIEHFGITDIGNVRKVNEDSFDFVKGPYGPVFTVCDGMGGHVGGATASSLATRTILDFITTSTVDNPSVTINNALISANQKILQAARENVDLKGMGTTATVLVVQPDAVYIGHVGDSRIYIYSDQRLHRLTKDHSFVQTLVDSGAITDAEAEMHPRKNELMKALGVTESIHPTLASDPIKPKAGDIFLMCTDGLCGLVTDEKMQRIISGSPSLAVAAEQLIAAAKNAGGHDNITAQLIKAVESPHSVSEFKSYTVRQKETYQPDNYTTQNTPLPPIHSIREAIRKKKKTGILVVAGLLAILLATTGAYVTDSWPFNSKTAGVDSTATVDPSNEGELLPGDRITRGYLIHTLAKGEKDLEKIRQERVKMGDIYKQFNYEITFCDDNKPVVGNNIKACKTIKWKMLETPPEVDVNPGDKKNKDSSHAPPLVPVAVASDVPKQPKPDPNEKNGTKKVFNKEEPLNEPAVSHETELRNLRIQRDEVDEQLIDAEAKLVEAKKEVSRIKESLDKTKGNKALIQQLAIADKEVKRLESEIKLAKAKFEKLSEKIKEKKSQP